MICTSVHNSNGINNSFPKNNAEIVLFRDAI